VAVFIDWPNDMMTNYLNLPLAEKQDYWRIFGAEAYANGIFPSFHLKDTVGSPTAEQQGMLDFFTSHSRFYAGQRAIYRDNHHAPEAVTADTGDVAASSLIQHGTGVRTLHLINHNYDRAIVPQTGVTVTTRLPHCPRRIEAVSPDFTGTKALPFSCRRGALRVTVDRLDYYTVLVLR
jgi:hypothetical protein